MLLALISMRQNQNLTNRSITTLTETFTYSGWKHRFQFIKLNDKNFSSLRKIQDLLT